MNRLSNFLLMACSELGLTIDLNFSLSLPNGSVLTPLARISDLGDENGMLVFLSFDEISSLIDHLDEAGYGFSVLEEALPEEEFDLESFKEMFVDWSWSGKPGDKPAWMR